MYICEQGQLFKARELEKYCVWVSSPGIDITIGCGEAPYIADSLKEALDFAATVQEPRDILIKIIKYYTSDA